MDMCSLYLVFMGVEIWIKIAFERTICVLYIMFFLNDNNALIVMHWLYISVVMVWWL
jgi:hypothetical protein